MGKPLVKFAVYEVDEFGGWQWLRNTWAVSPAQAINNVRFRLWGDTSVAELEIKFVAEVVSGVVPKPPRQPILRPEKSRPLCGRQGVWHDMLLPRPAF